MGAVSGKERRGGGDGGLGLRRRGGRPGCSGAGREKDRYLQRPAALRPGGGDPAGGGGLQCAAGQPGQGGEGDGSLAHWREVHRAFFTEELAGAGLCFTEDMPVLFEEFELLFRPEESEEEDHG